MLIGVAVDNYKQKAYKKAIKAAGFTIESVEWIGQQAIKYFN